MKWEQEALRLRGLVGCYALFQYLTVSIQAANAVYSQARETLEGLHSRLTLGYANQADSHANEENVSEEANGASGNAHKNTFDSSHASRRYASRLAHECEVLAVQQAMLLRYHVSTRVFPLATLRQTLTSALSAWPNSAPLWSIYTQVRLQAGKSPRNSQYDLIRIIKRSPMHPIFFSPFQYIVI